MSPVLPFDIIALIIDIVGENEDTNLLKELALVSYFFHQNCSKHLFATIELHDADPDNRIASSKKGFVKLLTSRPDVVKHIRKLTYEVKCTHPSQFRRSSALTHPFQFPPNNFLSQLPQNYFNDGGLEYSGLFPDISVPSPHASSYH